MVLRLSSMAHASWLRRIAPSLALTELPPATFTSQRRSVRSGADQAGDPEGPRVLSVFLGPEAADTGEVVRESDRGQVLDAILRYGAELVVVVENKIVEADDWQARNINLGTQSARLDSAQVPVAWRDVLEDFMRLLERGLVSGAERSVLEDFMDYVERYFGGLGPSRTLAMCRGNHYRQERRLRTLLTEATGIEAAVRRSGALEQSVPFIELPGAHTVKTAYLHMKDDEDAVWLTLFPADTLRQARTLYTDRAAVKRLLALGERSWELTPNFHFGFIRRNLAWSRPSPELAPVKDYITLWQSEIGSSVSIPRKAWPRYLDCLIEKRVAAHDYQETFDRAFTDTDRESATPRPGLRLVHSWAIADAERRDTERRLVDEVRTKINEALQALGEPSAAAATA
ncbi:MAG: hypothetical protein WKF33_07245 [Thermoleophilaceae bacterium]